MQGLDLLGALDVSAHFLGKAGEVVQQFPHARLQLVPLGQQLLFLAHLDTGKQETPRQACAGPETLWLGYPGSRNSKQIHPGSLDMHSCQVSCLRCPHRWAPILTPPPWQLFAPLGGLAKGPVKSPPTRTLTFPKLLFF